MLNARIGSADATYYNTVRGGVLDLLKVPPLRVLEIGCGAGTTLRALRDRGATYLCGFELNADAAAVARDRNGIDEVFVEDAESGIERFPDSSFDVVVASHILEHMVDPWRVARRILRLLKPGGQFLGAIPNVRHMSVLVPLLFRGDWSYRSEGIMDWTHLRFFTKSTIRQLLVSAGYADIVLAPDVLGPKSRLVSSLSAGLLNGFSAYAYNFGARKPLAIASSG